MHRRPVAFAAAASLVTALAAGSVAVAPATAAPPPDPGASPPRILPVPQQESAEGVPYSLKGTVRIVVGPATDAAAKDLLAETVSAAGGHPQFVTEAPAGGQAIYLGTTGDNTAIAPALAALSVDPADGLAAGGYVIASGHTKGSTALVLDGVDSTGTYYAVQSLRQVVDRGTVPAVRVRDWPLMSIRGAIEGFYGIPWSQQARLDQLAFYGAHKMNTYIYTPKDDAYLRAKWREPYPAAELAKLKALVDQANAHHVNFTFALSPGNDVCYSSDADFAATTAKFDQLRALGVTSFYIALDDIPLQLNCDADKAKFTKGNWGWLADAQTYYLNRLVNEYIGPNHLQPLQTVPTNYAGSGKDPYKDEFGLTLDPSVRVQWTGEGVFSDKITLDSVTKASANYHTDHLYIWDNFPVNDGQRGRLFLNPLTGRDPRLYTKIDGITSNPMIEPYASMIALAGYGDYTWNGPKYDPAVTQEAIINELAGPEAGVRAALKAFVDLNQNWKPYRPSSQDAPELSADAASFWSGYAAGDAAAMKPFEDRIAAIAALPETLKPMAQQGFYSDAKPWIDAASQWAQALARQITALRAIAARDGEAATDAVSAAAALRAQALRPTVSDLGGGGTVTPNAIVPSVGDGAFAAFYDKAIAAYNAWLEATPAPQPKPLPVTASSTMGTWSTNAIGRAVDGDLSTLYWSNASPRAGDAVTVDLGAPMQIGSVQVHQSDSDTTTGDIFYHASLQYSQDGTTWQSVPGTFDAAPLIQHTFPAPVQARYVRVSAAAVNPGGQWVKVREFQVFAPQTAITSDLTAMGGSTPANAFDGNVATAFAAQAPDAPGSALTRVFDAPQHVGSVAVVGTAAGSVQVQDAAGWHTVAQLAAGRSFQEAALNADGITAVRIVFDAGAPAPSVDEFVTRAGRPVGSA